MNKIVFLFASVAVTCCVAQSKQAPFRLQDPERVAEIPSYLPENITVYGARIGDRGAWARIARTPSGKIAVKKAKSRLNEPIPECPDRLYLEFSTPGNGNRRNYEEPYFRRMNSFVILAIGECVENKGRFIPRIVEYANAICAERTWTMPAHDRNLSAFKGERMNVDLGASHRAAACAWVLSVLREVLPAETVSKLRAELERRVFAPVRGAAVAKSKSGFNPMWWYQGRNNWTAVCHASVTFAALCTIEDRMDRAVFIEGAERAMPGFISGFTDDGYCSEGLGYWNYGWGEFLMLSLAVREATGGKVDFCSSPKTKTIMKFGTGVLVSGTTAASIADGGGNLDAGVLQLGHLIWPDIPMTPAAAVRKPLKFDITKSVFLDFGQWEKVPSAPTVDYPIRTLFPDAQMYVMRPSKADSMPLRLSVKSGHNAEFHNHNDVGTYALFFNDILLAGDSGGTVYTAKTFSDKRYEIKMINSYGHPVPVLNGELQGAGRQFEGKVLSTSFEDGRDVLTFDLSKAYDAKSTGVSALERTFVYDRTNQTFSVSDCVAFSGKGRFSVPVVTPGEMVASREGEYVISVRYGKEKVRTCRLAVSVKVEGSPWKIEEERIDNPGRISPNRYAITLTEPVASAKVTVSYRMVSAE